MKIPLQDGLHPMLESRAYRDFPDPANGNVKVLFANPKFARLLSHAFKSKRNVLSPADLAFVELVLVATLSGKTLGSFPDAEGAYRRFLLFAKQHLGRHHAVVPEGAKPRSFFIGRRFVAKYVARVHVSVVVSLRVVACRRIVRQHAGVCHDCFTPVLLDSAEAEEEHVNEDDDDAEEGAGASDSLPEDDDEEEPDHAPGAQAGHNEADEDEDNGDAAATAEGAEDDSSDDDDEAPAVRLRLGAFPYLSSLFASHCRSVVLIVTAWWGTGEEGEDGPKGSTWRPHQNHSCRQGTQARRPHLGERCLRRLVSRSCLRLVSRLCLCVVAPLFRSCLSCFARCLLALCVYACNTIVPR